jgi:hypothetical protein
MVAVNCCLVVHASTAPDAIDYRVFKRAADDSGHTGNPMSTGIGSGVRSVG